MQVHNTWNYQIIRLSNHCKYWLESTSNHNFCRVDAVLRKLIKLKIHFYYDSLKVLFAIHSNMVPLILCRHYSLYRFSPAPENEGSSLKVKFHNECFSCALHSSFLLNCLSPTQSRSPKTGSYCYQNSLCFTQIG